ncbi:protein MpBK1 [Marchantia polymorpha subsp. ruderalis]
MFIRPPSIQRMETSMSEPYDTDFNASDAFWLEACRYNYETPPYVIIVETVCGVFFLIDYVINLFSAPVRLYYIISATGLVDLLSVLPIAFLWSKKKNFGVEILLFLRVLRIMPVLTSIGLSGATITQQIFRLVVYAFGVIFIAAGLLQWVEYRASTTQYREDNNCSPKGCLTFFGAFYFMIVTISTVGYGDITPKSDWGRAVAILAILAALIILPAQVNNIMQLASRRPYGGYFAVKKVVGSRFIIVSGNLTFRTVQDFLSEFYHPNHDKDLAAFPIRVVLLAPFKPSFELKSLLAHYKGRVEFIQGTPLKDIDLDRVSANVASAIFLIADQHAQDPEAEDATQILRTLAVHRHCGSALRVIVELLKPERRANAIWDDATSDIEIICFESIRFKLLSRSCHIQGISTFVVNLFKQGLVVSKPEKGNWLRQYYHGLKQEVFPVLLPACFHTEELLFEEAAELLYERTGVILFALDVLIKASASREVVLFPKGRVLQSTDVGMAIAKNLEAAERVSKFAKRRKKACRHMASGCASCMTQSQLSDQDLLNLIKSKRYTLSEQSTSIDPIVTTSSGELTREPKATSPTQGLLDSVSNLQSQFSSFLLSTPLRVSVSSESASSTDTEIQQPQHISSLEEAIDLAMSWPPTNKHYKPDPPILERRADDIMDHLQRFTLSMVKLNEPHILVCMQGPWPLNLFYFVSHSRTLFPKTTPIVILHPNQPTATDWGCVGMFEGVYFIRGSPIYELDLIRAGVLQAVVIMTSYIHLEENQMIPSDQDETAGTAPATAHTQDVNNIVIAATVERLLRPVGERIIVELQQEAAFQYLRPKLYIDRRQFFAEMYRRNRVGTFQFAPPYIEGKTFCPQTLAFLTYATFFNRNCMSIVEQLLSGGKILSADGEDVEDDHLRVLDQIVVPKAFEGKSFGSLFSGLLRHHGMLAVGLYRPLKFHGSLVPYVFTNPPPHELLDLKDLVYILR